MQGRNRASSSANRLRMESTDRPVTGPGGCAAPILRAGPLLARALPDGPLFHGSASERGQSLAGRPTSLRRSARRWCCVHPRPIFAGRHGEGALEVVFLSPVGEPRVVAVVSQLARITVDPSVCHGKPVIRGLHDPVESMLD